MQSVAKVLTIFATAVAGRGGDAVGLAIGFVLTMDILNVLFLNAIFRGPASGWVIRPLLVSFVPVVVPIQASEARQAASGNKDRGPIPTARILRLDCPPLGILR